MNKYEDRVCPQCAKRFTPWRIDQVACSTACGRLYRSRRQARQKWEAAESRRYRHCSVCGSEFRSIRGAETCGTACRIKLPDVRERRNAQQREWHSRPEAADWRRNKALRIKYGIDLDIYQSMLTDQGGRCAICKEPPDSESVLAVDHDHETGEVRGLLCTRCNPGLGYFKDDPARLLAAIDYLQKEQVA